MTTAEEIPKGYGIPCEGATGEIFPQVLLGVHNYQDILEFIRVFLDGLFLVFAAI